MTAIDNTGAQLIATLEATKAASDQFSQLYFSSLQAGILQRDTRLAEFETELAAAISARDTFNLSGCTILDSDGAGLLLKNVTNTLITGCLIAGLQSTLADRESTITGLQQQLADLNARIDAAQQA